MIVDLEHCIQRNDEFSHHWYILLQRLSILQIAVQAILFLERNFHFQPFVQKLVCLKGKVKYMGDLMDILTRYVEQIIRRIQLQMTRSLARARKRWQ